MFSRKEGRRLFRDAGSGKLDAMIARPNYEDVVQQKIK